MDKRWCRGDIYQMSTDKNESEEQASVSVDTMRRGWRWLPRSGWWQVVVAGGDVIGINLDNVIGIK